VRTAQAAEILGLTANQLMRLIRRHEIDVPKDGDRYAWSEADLEAVRAALRRRQDQREEISRQGLTTRQAALELGIAYEDLLGLVRHHQIPVPRPGTRRHYAFDAASLALVRKALDEPPPPPRTNGLTTKQVASALGVSYETLIKIMGPLRHALPLEKDGGNLLWSAEAIGTVREALAQRYAQQWMGEVEDYGDAVRFVATLAGTLRKLSTEVEKLQGVLSRKPAETAFLHTLPERTHALNAPLGVLLHALPGTGFQASLAELALTTEGRTRQEALRLLRQKLWDRYLDVSAAPDSSPGEWAVLRQMIGAAGAEE